MELSVGQKLYGFTVTRARKAEELSGTLYEMTHDKTGAQLCWMDNGEMNKLFSVVFKTLPEDDTGVFHILEHSVLCGSEKYPVKEPFVDLPNTGVQLLPELNKEYILCDHKFYPAEKGARQWVRYWFSA